MTFDTPMNVTQTPAHFYSPLNLEISGFRCFELLELWNDWNDWNRPRSFQILDKTKAGGPATVAGVAPPAERRTQAPRPEAVGPGTAADHPLSATTSE